MSSKSMGKLAVLFVAFLACLVGVNAVTAPMIAKNAAAGEFEPLFAVMEDAEGFELVTDLADVDEKVVGVYRETSGKGYAVQLSTTEGYTHEPIEFTLGFDSEGKITNVNIISNPETKDWGAGYPETYIGEDSTLANVQLVAGVTYASSALKNATVAAFDALINNDLLKAGEMGPEQILNNMLLALNRGMFNPGGIAMYTELDNTGFAKGLASENGTGYAFFTEDNLLVMVNNSGTVAVYDLEGNDVTDAKEDVVAAAASYYNGHVIEIDSKDEKRLVKLVNKDASMERIDLGKSYNTVQAAYLINGEYYGYICKSYGYGNQIMDEYFVLDKDGAVVNSSAKEYIIEAEFFTSYTLDEDSYKAGLVGLTADTYTGEQTLISGATISSNAIGGALADVFAAHQAIVEGN